MLEVVILVLHIRTLVVSATNKRMHAFHLVYAIFVKINSRELLVMITCIAMERIVVTALVKIADLFYS